MMERIFHDYSSMKRRESKREGEGELWGEIGKRVQEMDGQHKIIPTNRGSHVTLGLSVVQVKSTGVQIVSGVPWF